MDDIDIHDFNKFSKKIYKNFYDSLKNSNYKTLKCYKLVFNSNYLKKNIGNFIVLSFFFVYLCFFVMFIIKGITPLQKEILKNIFITFKNVNRDDLNNIIINNNININNKKQGIIEFPPKKRKTINLENNLKLKEEKKNKKISSTFKQSQKKENDIINNPKKISIEDKSSNKALILESKKEILNNKNIEKSKEKRQSQLNKKQDTNKNLDDLELNNLPN